MGNVFVVQHCFTCHNVLWNTFGNTFGAAAGNAVGAVRPTHTLASDTAQRAGRGICADGARKTPSLMTKKSKRTLGRLLASISVAGRLNGNRVLGAGRPSRRCITRIIRSRLKSNGCADRATSHITEAREFAIVSQIRPRRPSWHSDEIVLFG